MHIVGLEILDRPFIGIYRKVNIFGTAGFPEERSRNPGVWQNESARTDGAGRSGRGGACAKKAYFYMFVCRGQSVNTSLK